MLYLYTVIHYAAALFFQLYCDCVVVCSFIHCYFNYFYSDRTQVCEHVSLQNKLRTS